MAPLPEIRPVPTIAPLPGAAAPAMQPAHVAGETTSGIPVAAPLHETPLPRVEAPVTGAEHRSADVIPFPSAAPEPTASGPGDAVVGGETVAIVNASELIETAVVPPPAEGAAREPDPAPGNAHEDNFLFVYAEALTTPKPQPP